MAYTSQSWRLIFNYFLNIEIYESNMTEKEKTELFKELELEATRLQQLLKDKQLGLFTWWSFLGDRFKRIHEIAEKLGY